MPLMGCCHVVYADLKCCNGYCEPLRLVAGFVVKGDG